MRVSSRAPVRIDLAGGWSDVPEFAEQHGGRVVNAAIGLYAHVECVVGGGRIRLIAEDIDERASFASPAELTYDGRLDLHKAALNMFPVSGGVEVVSRSDVPAGSGLGASGALDVALVRALIAARGEEYGAPEVAEFAYLLEASELGLLGGRQDQYAAALGGLTAYTFAEGSPAIESLDLPDAMIRDLRQHLMIAYTGQTHFSSGTHARVWESFRTDDGTVSTAIARMRDLVDPVVDSLRNGDWRMLADCIHENWVQQQKLDETIATDRTDKVERVARGAGAWAVKATGAGAGGCVLIAGPPLAMADVASAVEAVGAHVLQWEFDLDGVSSW